MLAVWCCVAGGVLWGLKPLYDWLVLDRMINTGYVASDWTDYIKFAFPLLCLGGVYALFSLYKNKVRNSAIILAAAIVSNGLFHFSEIYYPDSDIPFGLLFLFSGTVLMLAGALVLMLQLKRNQDMPRPLFRLAGALFIVTLLFTLSPFITGLFPVAVATGWLVGLMMANGFIWAGVGAILVKIVLKLGIGDIQESRSL